MGVFPVRTQFELRSMIGILEKAQLNTDSDILRAQTRFTGHDTVGHKTNEAKTIPSNGQCISDDSLTTPSVLDVHCDGR